VRRRDLAIAFASACLGVARLADAQSRVPHIVYLWLGPAGSDGETHKGFQAGLREFGYEEGRNLIVDYRYADGSEARLTELAAAAVAAKPDLISTFGGVVIGAVAKLTRTIPIVSLTGDPVGLGFAASLSRPGGNVTGMTVQVGPELAGKWLELLVEILPYARRIAMLRRASNPVSATELSWMRAAANRLVNGLTIDEYALREVTQLPSALEAIRQAKPDGLVVDNDVLLVSKAAEIAAVGLPAISGSRDFVDAGLLASYGASIFDITRRLAGYIDRILKDAKPADLPIEQPTKFELVINLKTAKTLGLTIPESMLDRADEVIE
jgi:putative tryptophan/tyrosine transport system substrate-binding protein